MTENPKDLLTNRTILVVEDMHAIAMDIKYILEDAGCRVVGPASTVTKALQFLNRYAVDGVITDIHLGEEKAFPLAQQLRSMHIPFIFLTGYSPHLILPAEFQSAPYLEKPFAERELLATVAQLFATEE